MNELLWAWVKIGGGLVILVGGGESLVRGASGLAAAVRISPLVIGLTVVAFGTSAPELAVSVQAAQTGSGDLAMGNVVGSNIFNVLFILGLSALIAPLVVSSQLIRRDVPVMIVASLLTLGFGWNGTINRWEGLGLFAGVVAYTWWCIRQSRKETREVQAEFAQEWPQTDRHAIGVDLALIVTGLCLLGIGSRLLVDGSVSAAESLGVSKLVIGLTIVAMGTSLPEVVTSIVAALRGERDIAVGNVVGSNIFNILCVLGLSSAIAPSGVAISTAALAFDIPVMIAVAVACLPIFFSGRVIARWEGALFFFYYVVYTVYLVSHAVGNDAVGNALRDAMIVFVIPLTTVTVGISVWRCIGQQHKSTFRRATDEVAVAGE
ncbi:MAG: calcium/sodium antiporter [Planctomycetales bacterium]|nr:calcium/sodium antiporter [Planctomycetales bacterium]